MRNLVVSNCLTLAEDINHKLSLIGLDCLQSLIECHTELFQPYLNITFDLLILKYGENKVGCWIGIEIYTFLLQHHKKALTTLVNYFFLFIKHPIHQLIWCFTSKVINILDRPTETFDSYTTTYFCVLHIFDSTNSFFLIYCTAYCWCTCCWCNGICNKCVRPDRGFRKADGQFSSEVPVIPLTHFYCYS